MNALKVKPFKGIGPVELGASLEKICSLGFYKNDNLSEAECECYELEHLGLMCYLDENHLVKSVKCWSQCELDGRNLIGISEAEMRTILGEPESTDGPIWVTDDRVQTTAEYDRLGIIVWIECGCTTKIDLWWNGVD